MTVGVTSLSNNSELVGEWKMASVKVGQFGVND